MRTSTLFSAACAAVITASTSVLSISASQVASSSSSSSSSLEDRVFRQDAGLRMKRVASKHHIDQVRRDASTLMSGGDNNEGEDHGPVDVPDGATLASLPVGNGGEEVAVFWPDSPNNSSAKHAYVMIHGRLRNGNDYWTIINDALQSAIDDNIPGAGKSDIVTAPQFYSTRYNSGQYSNEQLAFDDVNGWQASDTATHPSGTNKTSFDALDAFVTEFSNKNRYPNMQNVTFVGHGGGGQLIARYAQVAPDPPQDLHVRYIIGDPSSNAYFTDDRPNIDDSIANKSSCPWYNTWRYGFDNITLPYTPQAYFQRYVRRDVVSIVGYQDTDASGDTYCMAQLQGGTARRDRNLIWYKLMQTLGGTDEDVSGFPGDLPKLPDWSNMTDGAISLRLVVVENATHDASEVFGGEEGRSALFSDGDIEIGWRPDGWKAASKLITPGVTGVAGTDLIGSATNSSSSSSSSSSSGGSSSRSGSSSSTSTSKAQQSSGTAVSDQSESSSRGALSMNPCAGLQGIFAVTTLASAALGFAVLL